MLLVSHPIIVNEIKGRLGVVGYKIEQEVFDGSGMTGALLAPLAAGLAIPTTKAVLTRGPIGYIGRKIAGATTGAADDLRTLKQIDAEGGIGSGTSVVARQEGSAGARQKVGEILNKINDSPDAASNQEFIRRVGAEFGDIMNDPDLPLSMAQILGDPRCIARKTRSGITEGPGIAKYSRPFESVKFSLLKLSCRRGMSHVRQGQSLHRLSAPAVGARERQR